MLNEPFQPSAIPNSNQLLTTRGRIVCAICLLILFLICLGLLTAVLLTSGSPWLALPLTVVTLGILRLMRWVMIWFSTPAERQRFAPESEPLLNVVKSWVENRHSGS